MSRAGESNHDSRQRLRFRRVAGDFISMFFKESTWLICKKPSQ